MPGPVIFGAVNVGPITCKVVAVDIESVCGGARKRVAKLKYMSDKRIINNCT
jgi:hypothetical protein